MKDKLKVSFIQSYIDWQDVEANLTRFSKIINRINDSDLVILPEMFNTGFSMNPSETAELMSGKTISWMIESANNNNIALIASLAIFENNKYYNRLLFVFPHGKIEYYDKKHLFILSDEHKNFESGDEVITIDYLGWKIKPLICYDLRFPVWARNTEGYDLLVYIANWPTPRREQWLALLKARAIENQSFTIGVNRIGTDGNNYHYSGDSIAYNSIGEIMLKADNKEDVMTVNLQKAELVKNREYFPVLNDKDNFKFV